MNTAVALRQQAAIPALSMTEDELINVLESSLYPGAKRESIKLVIGYCKARGLDPLQKPVHIVPMNVKKAGTSNEYEWRDVVMPGIGLYRTQAAQSSEHVGTSEPEFGPMQTLTVGQFSMDYPEWCKVTVRRKIGHEVAEFTAVEYWLENYATAGRDSTAPNAMWKKRPRGQLAKCAEAQALRKGFPELGSDPTAEEMEGKVIDGEATHVSTEPQALRVPMPRSIGETQAATVEGVTAATAPKEPASGNGSHKVDGHKSADVSAVTPAKPNMIATIKARMANAGLDSRDLAKKFPAIQNPESLEGITQKTVNEILSWVDNPTG